MASRLSSLLVRDGLVGVKRMEKAFQRQVIYGGTLDTILLEMNLIPEERLLQYLSLSTGVPPATRAETDVFDAGAVRVLPIDVAEEYGVAPLSYDDETLRVVVKEPVDFGVLEDLANRLSLPIQPLVVPEYRFHVVFDRAYGKDATARFGALASRTRETPGTVPVGKPATVIIAENAPDPDEPDVGVVDTPLPPSTRQTVVTRAVPPVPVRKQPAHAQKRPDSEPSTGVPRAIDHAASTEMTQPRSLVSSGEVIAKPLQPTMPGPPTSTIKVATSGARTDRRPAVKPPLEHVLRPSPLSVGEASALLAEADDRDEIFSALLRATRSRAWYAGLLTVQGGVAIGRYAIAGSEIDTHNIGSVIIPLDTKSPFRQVIDTEAPYIGPIATHTLEIDDMVRRMGGVIPPAALLMPIALRNRVIAIVVAHRGADAIAITEVSELLPLAGATAEAISRLIIKAKRVGYRPARDESAPFIKPELVEQKMPAKPDGEHAGGEWTTPRNETAPVVDFGAAAANAGRPDFGEIRAISTLLDDIEADNDPGGALTSEVLRRAVEAVTVIAERFPGKLTVDRYSLGARPLRAERHGPLLGLVVKLGTASADMLIVKMRDSNRDVRYYATLCASELRPKSALRELVDRLFDPDYGVRVAATDALAGYPSRELDSALEGARRALHSDDDERVTGAAAALGELADVKSIPDLLDTLSRGGKAGQAVQHALTVLTRQDFGTSHRKWRAWWNKNHERTRVEWLLDSLGHKTAALREGAAEDLRRLTGEYFGFHHDLPRREREEARKKWQRWWNETGRRRFLREGPPESDRATGILPARSK